MALASNLSNYTATHVGRQIRNDLAFIPAIWAERQDVVLVEDVESAERSYARLRLEKPLVARFVELTDLPAVVSKNPDMKISPWGWNKALKATLMRHGVSETMMPQNATLHNIRELTNRHTAVKLLDRLKGIDGVTGLSRQCFSDEEVMMFLNNIRNIVVKSPWSSSGRGIRHLSYDNVAENTLLWISNVIRQQQSVVVEEECRKVMDFAMEYEIDSKRDVRALGLSLFSTSNGAYKGNVLDSEENKLMKLSRYIPLTLMNEVVKETTSFMKDALGGIYQGPFGVDMMVVANDEKGNPPFLLNPCIEINLRRTMGHVALALSQQGLRGSMNIVFDGKNYKMKIINEIYK